MMRKWGLGGALAGVLMLGAVSGEAQGATKTPPYWASLSVDEARMRVGPSEDYPANWVYRRKDLPVKVIQVHSNWRKIEDPDGTQGWVHVRLLSDTATGIVTVPVGLLHEAARDGATVLFRAEKGVVGRLSDCGGGWCRLDIHGKRGFIRADQIWGATQSK